MNEKESKEPSAHGPRGWGPAAIRGSWAERHPATLLGVLATLALVLGMAPVRDIMLDLPAVSLTYEGLLSLGLWVYIVALGLAYVLVTAIALTAPNADSNGNRARWVVRIVEALGYAPARRATAKRRRVVSAVLLLLGLGLFLHVLPIGNDPHRDQYWGLLSFVSGLWLLLGRFDEGEGVSRRLTRAAGWALELVVASSAVGEIFWWLVAVQWNPVSWRVYTLWAVIHLCVLVLVLAALADTVGRNMGERLGAALALVAVLIIVGGRPVTVGGRNAESKEASPGALDLSWFEAVERRLGKIPEHEPVILVAAAGGGARAALFATAVLEALERTHTQGSGSLADRVLFISSVSGGSVAGAHFVFGDPPPAPTREPRNTLAGELRTHVMAELDRLCNAAKSRCPDRACTDCRTAVECEATCLAPGCLDYARLCGAGSGEPNPREQLADSNALVWPFYSSRVDDMASDFNAPLMRGVVYPGVERGQSVTEFWRRLFHWQDNWKNDKAQDGSRPLLLANVTDVNAGTRLVVGFPPLPRGLFRAGSAVGGASSGLPFAQETRSLKDIDARLELDVEQAVRMSANFPWGFDLPQLGAGEETTLGIDGGVLDNTGIDTYTIIIDRLALLSDPLSARLAPEPLRKAAGALLDELSRRGVVLLEIDSGAKPEAAGSVADALANLALPVHALSMSSYVRATEATVLHSARMQEVLARHAERGVTTECGIQGSASVDLVGDRVIHAIYALDTDNLMTAWALSPKQKAQLLARFVAEDRGQRPNLLDRFEDLESANLMRCELLEKTRTDSPLRNLVEDLAIADGDLNRLKRAEVEVDAELRRHIYETGDASPPSRPDYSAHGWLLVGVRGRDRWMTLNLRLADRRRAPGTLDGSRLVTASPVYLYQRPPGADGSLEPFPAVLPSGVEIEVEAVERWRGSDFYFAKVRTKEGRTEPRT